jgi:hypothetical protein
VKKVDEVNPLKFEAALLYPMSVIAWALDWYSVVTTVMELSYSMQIFMDRMDYYNSGKMVGKLTKLVFQIHEKDIFTGRFQKAELL